MKMVGEWYEIVCDEPHLRAFLKVHDGRVVTETVDRALCDLWGEDALPDKLETLRASTAKHWADARRRLRRSA